MNEIFVAIIMIFDVQTSQLVGLRTAAFADEATCNTVVAAAVERSKDDMTLYVEGGCLATPVFGAE